MRAILGSFASVRRENGGQVPHRYKVREIAQQSGLSDATVDRVLNEHGYILPGLGDAGDRLFGTK